MLDTFDFRAAVAVLRKLDVHDNQISALIGYSGSNGKRDVETFLRGGSRRKPTEFGPHFYAEYMKSVEPNVTRAEKLFCRPSNVRSVSLEDRCNFRVTVPESAAGDSVPWQRVGLRCNDERDAHVCPICCFLFIGLRSVLHHICETHVEGRVPPSDVAASHVYRRFIASIAASQPPPRALPPSGLVGAPPSADANPHDVWYLDRDHRDTHLVELIKTVQRDPSLSHAGRGGSATVFHVGDFVVRSDLTPCEADLPRHVRLLTETMANEQHRSAIRNDATRVPAPRCYFPLAGCWAWQSETGELSFSEPAAREGHLRVWMEVIPCAQGDLLNQLTVDSCAHVRKIREELTETVKWLHQLGLAHGDLKPQNIFYYKDTASLIDFSSLCRLVEGPAVNGIADHMPLASTPGYYAHSTDSGELHDDFALEVIATQLLCFVSTRHGGTATTDFARLWKDIDVVGDAPIGGLPLRTNTTRDTMARMLQRARSLDPNSSFGYAECVHLGLAGAVLLGLDPFIEVVKQLKGILDSEDRKGFDTRSEDLPGHLAQVQIMAPELAQRIECVFSSLRDSWANNTGTATSAMVLSSEFGDIVRMAQEESTKSRRATKRTLNALREGMHGMPPSVHNDLFLRCLHANGERASAMNLSTAVTTSSAVTQQGCSFVISRENRDEVMSFFRAILPADRAQELAGQFVLSMQRNRVSSVPSGPLLAFAVKTEPLLGFVELPGLTTSVTATTYLIRYMVPSDLTAQGEVYRYGIVMPSPFDTEDSVMVEDAIPLPGDIAFLPETNGSDTSWWSVDYPLIYTVLPLEPRRIPRTSIAALWKVTRDAVQDDSNRQQPPRSGGSSQLTRSSIYAADVTHFVYQNEASYEALRRRARTIESFVTKEPVSRTEAMTVARFLAVSPRLQKVFIQVRAEQATVDDYATLKLLCQCTGAEARIELVNATSEISFTRQSAELGGNTEDEPEADPLLVLSPLGAPHDEDVSPKSHGRTSSFESILNQERWADLQVLAASLNHESPDIERHYMAFLAWNAMNGPLRQTSPDLVQAALRNAELAGFPNKAALLNLDPKVMKVLLEDLLPVRRGNADAFGVQLHHHHHAFQLSRNAVRLSDVSNCKVEKNPYIFARVCDLFASDDRSTLSSCSIVKGSLYTCYHALQGARAQTNADSRYVLLLLTERTAAGDRVVDRTVFIPLGVDQGHFDENQDFARLSIDETTQQLIENVSSVYQRQVWDAALWARQRELMQTAQQAALRCFMIGYPLGGTSLYMLYSDAGKVDETRGKSRTDSGIGAKGFSGSLCLPLTKTDFDSLDDAYIHTAGGNRLASPGSPLSPADDTPITHPYLLRIKLQEGTVVFVEKVPIPQ